MRILALITDAFGGHGGIAKFNRDLLTALCTAPQVNEVVALPRLVTTDVGPLPEKLRFVVEAAASKGTFIRRSIRESKTSQFDLVWCGHLNLLPLAWFASRRSGAKLVLNLHGIEAWKPHRNWLVRRLLSRVDHFVSVSEFTKGRIRSWADLDPSKFFILPNCVDLSAFGPGPRNPGLIERYGLQGKTTIMTLARLSAAERYKGIDEVLEVLPDLARDIPNLAYLICGDGDDRPRLMAKADTLGLRVIDASNGAASPFSVRSLSPLGSPVVVFTGRVSEQEKADHFRLADGFVMAGWGEGFGIVYLEALACGIPVIASRLDASQEAVLGGEIGLLVDPKNPKDLCAGIARALAMPRRVPARLEFFSFRRFQERTYAIATHCVGGSGTGVRQVNDISAGEVLRA